MHEEVLRLLLAAAPQLSVAQVAQYLQSTLNNSKKSRRWGPWLPSHSPLKAQPQKQTFELTLAGQQMVHGHVMVAIFMV